MATDQSLAALELEDHGDPEAVKPLAEPSERRGLLYPLGKWIPEPGTLHEVAPGVSWLRMPLPMSLDHINLWVLEDGDGVTLVDTGVGIDSCKAVWEQIFEGPLAGRTVKRVLVTHYHPDHLGLAGWLCERTGAPLWMSRAEYLYARVLTLDASATVPAPVVAFFEQAGWSEQSIAMLRAAGWGNFAKGVSPIPISFHRIHTGDVIEIGGRPWQVLMGSGHSPEHVCLHQSDLGLLIAGDQLLPRITSNISVYPTEPEANPLADWFASLDMLATLPENTLVLPAHNEPFSGVQERCRQLREDHEGKLERLIAHVAEAPRSVVECFPVLFRRKLSGMEYGMGTGEALAHINYLLRSGSIASRQRGPALEYIAA